MRHRVLPTVAGLLILGLAGCASHVEWAPDSKSFLYSHRNGRILRFDVATRTSTEVTRTKAYGNEAWPVFSQRASDGLIVYAESYTFGDNSPRVRTLIHFVQPDGTALRTNELVWFADDDETSRVEPVPSYVEWSPKESYVLVTTESSVALHDFSKGTFTVREELAPALPMELGASPWRPDGAGFLATKPAEFEEDDLFFVTLDGEVHALEELKSDDVDENKWPVGEWQGNTLVSVYGKAEFRIDTVSGKITRRPYEGPKKHRWTVGKATLKLVGKGDDAAIVWSNGDQRVEVGRGLGAAFSVPTGPVVPSPDGNWAIVVIQSGLVLVGEQGVVEHIPVAPDGADGNK